MNEEENEERLWATFTHLAAFAGFLFPFLGNVIAPLVIWLIKKDEYPLVDDQGKESINFQITITIGSILCTMLMFILIGFPLLFALIVFDVVVVIMATIKAREGERYRYPFAFRFLK